MPDWFAFVKDRLGRLGLDSGRESEIISELADHLADLSEEHQGGGLPEEPVMRCALEQVHDWERLRCAIRRAELGEVNMSHRFKSVWLPGLLTGAAAWELPYLLGMLGLHPPIVTRPYFPLIYFLPWMLSLPLIGALGAFGSRRAGGSPRDMILVGIFPVLAMTALLILIFPAALIDVARSSVALPLVLSALASATLGYVIIPGVALLVGVIPVTLAFRREPKLPAVHA